MKRNLPGRVIDITPATPDNNKGKEIAEWLAKYGIHDTRYVIIDDEEGHLALKFRTLFRLILMRN